jgi:anti-anti-sigma factor
MPLIEQPLFNRDLAQERKADMTAIATQMWKSTRFDVQRYDDEPGMITFCLSGPFTARDMYSNLSPADLCDVLQCLTDQAQVHCFDVTGVPYMDRAGVHVLMNHYEYCQTYGIRMIAEGMNARVLAALKAARMEDTFCAPVTA